MPRENSVLRCPFNTDTICKCRHVSEIATTINFLGTKDPFLRGSIQRLGFDQVNPQLINEIIKDLLGTYYTTAFNSRLSFPSEIKGPRNYIINKVASAILSSETDSENIGCPTLREIIKTNENYDPLEMINTFKNRLGKPPKV